LGIILGKAYYLKKKTRKKTTRIGTNSYIVSNINWATHIIRPFHSTFNQLKKFKGGRVGGWKPNKLGKRERESEK